MLSLAHALRSAPLIRTTVWGHWYICFCIRGMSTWKKYWKKYSKDTLHYGYFFLLFLFKGSVKTFVSNINLAIITHTLLKFSRNTWTYMQRKDHWCKTHCQWELSTNTCANRPLLQRPPPDDTCVCVSFIYSDIGFSSKSALNGRAPNCLQKHFLR